MDMKLIDYRVEGPFGLYIPEKDSLTGINSNLWFLENLEADHKKTLTEKIEKWENTSPYQKVVIRTLDK